jgi:hypothetical protein
VRMGACKYQCANRLRTNSANCINKLSMAISRAVLSVGLALRGLGCVLRTAVSNQANRLLSIKESASATLRNKYFVTYYPIKLYHEYQIGQLKNTPKRSVVGCLRLTIPSVRSLRHYTCASCSIKYTTTTSTTNKVNRRIIVIVPPYEFSFIAEATHHFNFISNQPKENLTIAVEGLTKP